jgi:hypothetical protein
MTDEERAWFAEQRRMAAEHRRNLIATEYETNGPRGERVARWPHVDGDGWAVARGEAFAGEIVAREIPNRRAGGRR